MTWGTSWALKAWKMDTIHWITFELSLPHAVETGYLEGLAVDLTWQWWGIDMFWWGGDFFHGWWWWLQFKRHSSNSLVSHQCIPDTYTHCWPKAPLTFSSSSASSPFWTIHWSHDCDWAKPNCVSEIPCSIYLSLSFLTLYISVLSPVHCMFPMS